MAEPIRQHQLRTLYVPIEQEKNNVPRQFGGKRFQTIEKSYFYAALRPSADRS